MFANLQLRPAKAHRRKRSLPNRAGVSKRRVSAVSPVQANNVPSMSFMEELFGNEFPEAFGHSKCRKTMLDLPAEVLAIISEHVTNIEIKRMRLTCRHLANNVDLRINRVYISPSHANLHRLHWIMEQPRYRNQIHEIVWDDAQLEEYATFETFANAINNDEKDLFTLLKRRFGRIIQDYEEDDEDSQSMGREDFFAANGRLTHIGKDILMQCNDPFAKNLLNRDATLMSLEESYTLYQKLYSEERQLIEHEADVEALDHALSVFPAISRVAITSQVWKPWSLPSHYSTAFQLMLPPGFRKPSVWPWLGLRPHVTPKQEAYRMKTMNSPPIGKDASTRSIPDDWRGYKIVTSALANMCNPTIQDFAIDAGPGAGIYHNVFAFPHRICHETIPMFHAQPLRRLQLTLNAYYLDPWILRIGKLEESLSALRHLEHLDLDMNCIPRTSRLSIGDDVYGQFNVLHELPTDLVPRLKTLALRNVIVDHNDLRTLLEDMTSVEHTTFDNVILRTIGGERGGEEAWHLLFNILRLAQQDDASMARPQFSWISPLEAEHPLDIRCRLIDEEIDAFLYRGAESPFVQHADQESMDVGWIVWDQEPGRFSRLGEETREQSWVATTPRRLMPQGDEYAASAFE